MYSVRFGDFPIFKFPFKLYLVTTIAKDSALQIPNTLLVFISLCLPKKKEEEHFAWPVKQTLPSRWGFELHFVKSHISVFHKLKPKPRLSLWRES